MYVRIEQHDKKYYSYVFAYFEYDYMPEYVVYNPIDEKFEIVANFSNKCDGHRQVGIMDNSEKDFIKIPELKLNKGMVNNCCGYDWLINNVELLKKIEEGKPIDEKYETFAKQINSTINEDAWNEVLTDEDVEKMMNALSWLHDWYLVEINAKTNPYDCDSEAKVQLKFTSQAAFDALLEFDDPCIKYHFEWANRIYLSCIKKNNENIYWIDGDEEVEIEDIENYDYISGSNLRWKFILKEENDW